MSPTGDLLVTSVFAGEVSSSACLGAFMCCAGMALRQWQQTLWGNCWIYLCYMGGTLETLAIRPAATAFPTPQIQMLWLPPPCPSQRSLHSAPIFRLLLAVAVKHSPKCRHQTSNLSLICDFHTIPVRNHPEKLQCPCVQHQNHIKSYHILVHLSTSTVHHSTRGRATKNIQRCFRHDLCQRVGLHFSFSTGIINRPVPVSCRHALQSADCHLKTLAELTVSWYSTLRYYHEKCSSHCAPSLIAQTLDG